MLQEIATDRMNRQSKEYEPKEWQSKECDADRKDRESKECESKGKKSESKECKAVAPKPCVQFDGIPWEKIELCHTLIRAIKTVTKKNLYSMKNNKVLARYIIEIREGPSTMDTASRRATSSRKD
jgi:hypothetical protein